jgi:hypothetical protein
MCKVVLAEIREDIFFLLEQLLNTKEEEENDTMVACMKLINQ